MNRNAPQLEGKVALITGGSSGIGKGIAERFAAEGARLIVADIDVKGLRGLKQQIGDMCETIEANVTVEADLERAAAKAIERFGRLDIAVNAAGLASFGPIIKLAEAQWDHVLDVSLKGVFLSMKHEARQMKALGNGGVIINIASLNSRQPAEGMSAYCAAKAGVEMLTKVGGMELARHGVRVCAISPGLIESPATEAIFANSALYHEFVENAPLGRSGTVEDVANAALFLASSAASWITGTNLFVDGGALTKRYPELMKSAGASKQKQPE